MKSIIANWLHGRKERHEQRTKNYTDNLINLREKDGKIYIAIGGECIVSQDIIEREMPLLDALKKIREDYQRGR